MLPTHEAVLKFRIPPQPQLSRVVRDGVAGLARAYGVGNEDLANFLTALGEAIANAMEHARVRKMIEIEVQIAADRMHATVHDNGVGFDATRLAGPVLPDPSAERGRGFPIMRHCSDVFAIASDPAHGTTVQFGRFVRRANATASVA